MGGTVVNQKLLFVTVSVLALSACASTPPTKIGADTYYAAKTNTAGAFGSVQAVAGKLMVQGNQFCASMQKQFELVTENVQPPVYGSSLGGASITFKCVANPGNPVMRKDNGVTTIDGH